MKNKLLTLLWAIIGVFGVSTIVGASHALVRTYMPSFEWIFVALLYVILVVILFGAIYQKERHFLVYYKCYHNDGTIEGNSVLSSKCFVPKECVNSLKECILAKDEYKNVLIENIIIVSVFELTREEYENEL